jgi:hypothetical protein
MYCYMAILVIDGYLLLLILWKVGFFLGLHTLKYQDQSHRVSNPRTFRVLGVRFTGAPEKNGGLVVASHH